MAWHGVALNAFLVPMSRLSDFIAAHVLASQSQTSMGLGFLLQCLRYSDGSLACRMAQQPVSDCGRLFLPALTARLIEGREGYPFVQLIRAPYNYLPTSMEAQALPFYR